LRSKAFSLVTFLEGHWRSENDGGGGNFVIARCCRWGDLFRQHGREFVCAELGPHPADANTVSCRNANRDVRLGKKSNAHRGGVADLWVLIVGYANSDALQLDEAQSGAAHPGSFGGTVHNCHRAAIEILPKSEELADSEKTEEKRRQAEENCQDYLQSHVFVP
jgi:hypothetical protein